MNAVKMEIRDPRAHPSHPPAVIPMRLKRRRMILLSPSGSDSTPGQLAVPQRRWIAILLRINLLTARSLRDSLSASSHLGQWAQYTEIGNLPSICSLSQSAGVVAVQGLRRDRPEPS